jgi:hypothetical protein
MKISTTISDTPWGDVDKSAIGSNLANAYAKGNAPKAQIKFVYLVVPNEAFGKDADGNSTFAYSKASFPIAEVSSTTITINRNGVHAAAQRLVSGNLSAADLTAAKRRLRGLYKKLKETPPAATKESLAEPVLQLGRGKEVTELVKGSAEYVREEIRTAFSETFQTHSPYSGDLYCPWSIVDTFADAIVVSAWGEMNDLASDEFYRVTYTKNADGTYTFADEANWEVVELTYQTQTVPAETSPGQPAPDETPPAATGESLSAETRKRLKEKGERVIETLPSAIEFVESTQSNPDGPWRVRGIGITADIVNGNNRRYPAAVLRRAVNDLKQHINESAGQGRALSLVTGESDHPSDKGNRRPLYSEIVVNWNDITFDGNVVSVEGLLLGTQEGKDIRARSLGGVLPGLSQRSYIESKPVKENGSTVEEVTDLLITGYDFTVPGDQSDPNGAAQIIETTQGEPKMTKEELEQYLKEHPELFKGLITGEVKALSDDAIKAVESKVRELLKIDDKADIGAALKQAVEAQETLQAQTRQKTVDEAIAAQTKDLPYGAQMNKLLVEEIRSANPQDEAAVKSAVESLRKRYDATAAAARLGAMGYRGPALLAPVIESELGIPGFARASHEVTEALVRRGQAKRRDWTKLMTPNELFAAQVLELFDKSANPYTKIQNQLAMIQESKLVEEAEQTTDLNLPVSTNRAIIAEALPTLIASSVFDFGVTDASPFNLFYESYAGESGSTATITNETVTADLNAWVELDYKRVTPGSVTVTDSDGSPTYTEGTDYVIDYANGKIMAIATISDSQSIKVTYGYSAIRLGEMAPIQRGKGQLDYITVEAMADRLATQISKEAIVFSRSQIGWDATARTLAMLIKQIQRKIDEGVFYLALASALQVADNSGGTWTAASDELDELVSDLGLASTKIAYRYYPPTAYLGSLKRMEALSHWLGFTAAGQRPGDERLGNGLVGSLNGIPCFSSTEFSDGYILAVNRELVAHRVYVPMSLNGPYPSYHTDGTIIAADQWFAEEFNVTASPIPGKGAYVKIS